MAEPLVYHRGPEFRPVLERVLARLPEVFRSRNDAILFTASGSGAMESAVANLVSPGDRVLVVSAGHFGQRWSLMARRLRRRGRGAAVRVGRDAEARGRGRAPRRVRRRDGAVLHACGDLDGRRLRRPRDRGASTCSGRPHGGGRDLVTRRDPARAGRLGHRRGRVRLAEGAHDAPRAGPGVAHRRRARGVAPGKLAAVLPRLGACSSLRRPRPLPRSRRRSR